MRIVVLTSESLPANVITETLLREMPGLVEGIVVSTAMMRGISAPRALWRHARRMGPRFFAMYSRYVLTIRALGWLRRIRRPHSLPPGLRELAARASISLIGTRDINSDDSLSALRAMAPDLLVSIYFNQRIGAEVLGIARGGAINLHPAMLPRHRGPSPCFWVIAAGERQTGVTVHWIDAGIDTGDILLQREVMVPAGASVSALTGMVAQPGAAVLVEAVHLIEAGRALHQPQDAREATYQSFPTGRDLKNLGRSGGRYGSARELVDACERRDDLAELTGGGTKGRREL